MGRKIVITVQLKDIIGSSATFQKIAKTEMNAVDAYYITRLIQKIEIECNNFEKVKNQLIDKYCEKDDQGKPQVDKNKDIIIKEGYFDVAQKELYDLMDTEVTLEVEPISLDSLKKVNLSPIDMQYLIKFIK